MPDPRPWSWGGGLGGWSGSSEGVEPGGWGEHRPPAFDGDGPVGVVDDVVVVLAEQHQVVKGGRAAVGPVLDVVGVGPPWWAPAAGERAPAVSGDQRPAQPGWDDPGGAADVQRLGRRPEHDGDDGGVAGQLAGPPRGDGGAGLGDR